jgi:hypothetical protein
VVTRKLVPIPSAKANIHEPAVHATRIAEKRTPWLPIIAVIAVLVAAIAFVLLRMK